MIQAEKNMKHRFSNLPISIGCFLKIGFAVAGFVIWGWAFVAVVTGLYIVLHLLKGLISCFLSLLIIMVVITLLIAIIF